MNPQQQNCIIPALLWYPTCTDLAPKLDDTSVSFVSFGYRVEPQHPTSYFLGSTAMLCDVGDKQPNCVSFASFTGGSKPLLEPTPKTQPVAKDPFSPECLIPMPNIHGDPLLSYEPVFVRRRNERERQRVRCVNDGYSRLRLRLPEGKTQKRMSKVDILKCAISYIRNLQLVLEPPVVTVTDESEKRRESSNRGSRPG